MKIRKHLSRLIAVLLVACLVADPVTATGVRDTLRPVPRPIQQVHANGCFEEQALMLGLITAHVALVFAPHAHHWLSDTAQKIYAHTVHFLSNQLQAGPMNSIGNHPRILHWIAFSLLSFLSDPDDAFIDLKKYAKGQALGALHRGKTTPENALEESRRLLNSLDSWAEGVPKAESLMTSALAKMARWVGRHYPQEAKEIPRMIFSLGAGHSRHWLLQFLRLWTRFDETAQAHSVEIILEHAEQIASSTQSETLQGYLLSQHPQHVLAEATRWLEHLMDTEITVVKLLQNSHFQDGPHEYSLLSDEREGEYLDLLDSSEKARKWLFEVVLMFAEINPELSIRQILATYEELLSQGKGLGLFLEDTLRELTLQDPVQVIPILYRESMMASSEKKRGGTEPPVTGIDDTSFDAMLNALFSARYVQLMKERRGSSVVQDREEISRRYRSWIEHLPSLRGLRVATLETDLHVPLLISLLEASVSSFNCAQRDTSIGNSVQYDWASNGLFRPQFNWWSVAAPPDELKDVDWTMTTGHLLTSGGPAFIDQLTRQIHPGATLFIYDYRVGIHLPDASWIRVLLGPKEAFEGCRAYLRRDRTWPGYKRPQLEFTRSGSGTLTEIYRNDPPDEAASAAVVFLKRSVNVILAFFFAGSARRQKPGRFSRPLATTA